MELAKGGDLFDIYIKNEHLPAESRLTSRQRNEVAKFISAGVILGLEYLRKLDIIYRDLKPENILILDDGYPLLADFGLSKKIKAG